MVNRHGRILHFGGQFSELLLKNLDSLFNLIQQLQPGPGPSAPANGTHIEQGAEAPQQ